MMQGKSRIYGGRQSAWRSFAVTLRMLPCLRLRRSCSRQRIGVVWFVGVEVLCVQSSLYMVPLSLSSTISRVHQTLFGPLKSALPCWCVQHRSTC